MKRRVSFRVRRTLPRNPNVLFRSATADSDEQENLVESVEMEELPSVQESSVEIQMVEMAPLPSEGNPLDSSEDDDGLLEWWRTVEGWDEWNESSNFQEDEEDMAVEQAADRVFMAAQLFVRLFNQRGASLQQRILELLSVADEADNFHKRTVAASMGGGVASVVGSVTTITGLILAPFTFGSSIIVTAVGIGVATAGSIASASANITDTVHSKMDRKKVEKMIQGYQEEIKDIRECMDFVQEGMDTLQEWNFEKYTDSVAKRAMNQNVKHVFKEGARAGKALMINTDQLISTVQVLSVAGGAAKAAQAISVTTGVMSALFLALDIFFLAKDGHELRKGAKTQFASKIREVCKELQDGLLQLNRVKTELQKTMDGIEVEEVVEEEEEEEEEDSDLECDPEKLALLEEEINQMEQKLDQQVQEKKCGERENDSEEHHVKLTEDGKIEKSEMGGERVEEEGRLEKDGKVERGAGKDEKLKEEIQDEDGTEQRTKGNQEEDKQVGGVKREGKSEKMGRDGPEKGEKREGDERGNSEKRERYEHRKTEKGQWEESGRSAKREKEGGKSAKRDGDEQRKREKGKWDEPVKNEKRGVEHEKSGKTEHNAMLNSLPPSAQPRSKAFSNVPEEARCEGPVTEPKAPPPVPHRKRVSHREPLSI
ncbi:hypothetical protein AGOR_G00032410 [Albula goreensis]|uniref:Uncharacterized protein n=1 Tax=Albula goreensis TaxID=1534307 RepID=A0A8T3DWE3_9TELE|nr:hypothetical protein AGOR_G00032410 [Albula goreensis]